MKLRDLIKQAVETRDSDLAGKAVDYLRFRFKMDYSAVLFVFHELTDISMGDFEVLMQEADS